MKTKLLLISVMLLQSFAAFCQQGRIPVDKKVKIGKLANGLTYYIRQNAKPAERAELRLVVNAGSVLEREDQRGVAHFLEHMAFNGTKNFPKNELLNYLQKTGVRFGADLNATTSFDFTLYMLPIPASDAAILQNGYQVLRDWAGGLLLEQDEIDKERGIILEEKRMRQNAGMRMFSAYVPDMLNNSKYSQRLPIGSEEIIKTAPRKAFTDFYKDWYRPNNMAVIVVGDIDPAKTEATIKKLFGDLKNPLQAPVRPAITPIKWHASNKAKIVSDPENTSTMLNIYLGMEKDEPEITWPALSKEKLAEVIGELFSGRLNDYTVDPKSPIGSGNISLSGSFFRGYKTTLLSAFVKNNPQEAVNIMIAELLRAKKFGFTQPELDRVKKTMLKDYEELLAEKDKTESASHVAEYIQHFLAKDPIPGIEAEKNFIDNFLKDLTLEQVNKSIAAFNINAPAFVLLNATEAQKNSITADGLLTALENAKNQSVTAYTEKKISGDLLSKMPVAGSILKTEENAEFGSKLYSLSNGIKVISKKTDFKNDEIVFKGAQWGGLTNLSTKEIIATKYFSLVNSLGVGSHKGADMPKLLAGVQANLNVFMTPYQLNLFGNTTPGDLEKYLQLIYLKMTRVNFDKEEFEGRKEGFSSQVGGLSKNPQFKFSDTLNKFRYNYSERLAGIPAVEELAALSSNDLETAYTKATTNLNGAIFAFSGNIDETKLPALLEKYIASIPTQTQPQVLNKQNIVKAIKGNNSFTFKAGKENKSQINHTYYAEIEEISDKEILAFSLLGDILQMKANEKLREEMGSTYSPSVSAFFSRPPVGMLNLSLSVSSLPENVEKLIAAYDGLVKNIMNGAVSDEDMVKARAQRIKVVETQSKTNMYWSNVLEQQQNYGFDPKNISEYTKRVEALTKEDIVSVAKNYLSNANILKGVMNPE